MKIIPFLLLAAGIQASAATVLYSDLGTGGSVYNSGSGSLVQGSGTGSSWITQARPFAVSGTGDFSLTQFDLGVSIDSPFAGTFTASIWTDVSNRPGTELGSWDLSTTTAPNTCCDLATQSGISGITLTGGDQYWMVLGPQNSTDASKIEWKLNNQGVNSLVIGSLDGGATWIAEPGTSTTAAFDVLGDAAPSGVPEPSFCILAGAAFLAMLAVARRS